MYTWIPLSSSADLAQLSKHISAEYAPDRIAQRLADGTARVNDVETHAHGI
jgi:hypothetical protein